MTDEERRAAVIERIAGTRERWLRLVAEVGSDRSEQPGAMGDWTFKDVAAHLTAWRSRTIVRLEAATRGDPPPPPPWAADLGQDEIEDDRINAWLHARDKDNALADVLTEADGIYDVFIAAVASVPIFLATDPNRFDWMEGQALVDADFSGHLDEHEPDVRAWLARA